MRWLVVVLAAAMFMAAAACGSDDGDGAPAGAATDEANDLASMSPAAQVAVEMRDLAFEPALITMRAGEVVEIGFENRGVLLHDFTIDEIDADVVEMMAGSGAAVEGHSGGDAHGAKAAMHMALDAGQDGAMRVRVHEPGEYAYYCSVPGHREAGMAGTLVVE